MWEKMLGSFFAFSSFLFTLCGPQPTLFWCSTTLCTCQFVRKIKGVKKTCKTPGNIIDINKSQDYKK